MELLEAKQTPELVRTLVQKDIHWFEESAMAVLLQDNALMKMLNGVLCHNPKTGRFLEDFSKVILNGVYALRLEVAESLGWDADIPNQATLSGIIEILAGKGQYIAPSEEEEVMTKFLSLSIAPIHGIKGTVYKGLLYWLQLRRHAHVFGEYGTTLDNEDLSLAMREFTGPTEIKQEEEYDHHFGHGVRNQTLDVKRIPTGFLALDKALGGGFGYTEYTFIVSVQGGGKTVMACQITTSMSIHGAHGALITTEQSNDQLEPRIIACHAGVPFGKIKDKVDLRLFSDREAAAYEDLEKRLAGKFRIVNWNKKTSKTVVADLGDEIKRLEDKMQHKLDYLALDWLGGNLGAQGMDPTMKRVMLQDASNEMGHLADSRNMATIAFGQANMKQAANKKAIDAEHISENKQLGEKAANVIGISSLISKDDVDGAPTFAEQQYLYFAKSRKTTGGFVPVKRDFGYQRFIA